MHIYFHLLQRHINRDREKTEKERQGVWDPPANSQVSIAVSAERVKAPELQPVLPLKQHKPESLTIFSSLLAPMATAHAGLDVRPGTEVAVGSKGLAHCAAVSCHMAFRHLVILLFSCSLSDIFVLRLGTNDIQAAWCVLCWLYRLFCVP